MPNQAGRSLVLSHGDVRMIRRLLEQECPTCGQSISVARLAERYGVSKQTIYQIKWGKIRYGRED